MILKAEGNNIFLYQEGSRLILQNGQGEILEEGEKSVIGDYIDRKWGGMLSNINKEDKKLDLHTGM